MSETPDILVGLILEDGELYGPPAPDKHLQALGTMRHIRMLKHKADRQMAKIEVALQLERQFKKLGITKADVGHYVRQCDTEIHSVGTFSAQVRDIFGSYNAMKVRKPPYPEDTILGVELTGNRGFVKFDLPLVVSDPVKALEYEP